ncbi:MAG TPA: hypothetical protein VHP11_10900, partial [Tepidisphaeraceae bacterium]|nr:hypothetical protein [Tepidisphaeraceae bacterium]
AILDRVNGKLNPVVDYPFANISIPANGFLILESYNPAGGNQTYRPPSSRLNLTGTVTGATTVSILTQSYGREVVLLRPKDPGNLPTGLMAFRDMVPVDQFDFSGIAKVTPRETSWHYLRSSNNWEFIYPGRYDGSSASRYQGLENITYKGSAFNPALPQAVNEKNDAIDPWNPNSNVSAPFQNGKDSLAVNRKVSLGSANTSPSYINACVIPWETSLSQPPKITAPQGNSNLQYPFGGFARNADILQVPFIGAYVIKDRSTGDVIEMNSVTMDSAFAEDTYPTNNEKEPTSSGVKQSIVDNKAEQVGRFCPVNEAPWYDWTIRLFDYIDVQVPADDYFPNMPIPLTTSTPANQPNAPAPVPVGSQGQPTANANRGLDDLAATEGKININTAPPRVLAMLPLVPNAAGLNEVFVGGVNNPSIETLARIIARYRNDYWEGTTNNPKFPEAYESIIDLNRVKLVREAAGRLATSAAATKLKQGNYYGDATNSGFDERFLIANRVSNLITTRSDSFTCYIVVQGWREAGTDLPCLEWEQRQAFIVDRSAGPDDLKIIPVPTD